MRDNQKYIRWALSFLLGMIGMMFFMDVMKALKKDEPPIWATKCFVEVVHDYVDCDKLDQFINKDQPLF